jgi:hypothetical protein
MVLVVLKPAARLFPSLPNLRQEGASANASENQPRMAGLGAADHIRYDGAVQASHSASHFEYIDGGFTRDGVEQRLEFVDSRREGLVPDHKLEWNFDGKRGVVCGLGTGDTCEERQYPQNNNGNDTTFFHGILPQNSVRLFLACFPLA